MIKVTSKLKIVITLGALLFLVAACNNAFIEFVPAPTLTPVSVAAIADTSIQPPVLAGNTPTRIVAAAIALDAPIEEMGWDVIERNGEFVSEWDMPHNEAAWHQNSARLGGGDNIVISGHNESSGGQVFAEIEELQVGDEITLWNDKNETFVYQVIEKNIIRTLAASTEAQSYLRTMTESTSTEQLTLITCWPRWSNTHRLIVIAEPKME